MGVISDSIEINANPKKVFDFFAKLEKNYKKWHKDHVGYTYLMGEPMKVGSIVYAQEYLHGRLHKMKFKMMKVVPEKRIEYKILFPLSLITPKGSFLLEKHGKGCLFTATLSFRFGKVLSLFAGKEILSIRQHMKEEGENLKRILESR
jgi:hypothetical protein